MNTLLKFSGFTVLALKEAIKEKKGPCTFRSSKGSRL